MMLIGSRHIQPNGLTAHVDWKLRRVPRGDFNNCKTELHILCTAPRAKWDGSISMKELHFPLQSGCVRHPVIS